MILEIKKYPDPILRKKAREVKEIGEEERELIKNMIETMYAQRGVGLAAPQVGVLKRIVVVDIGEGPRVFINPKIVKKGEGKEISEEGCLSVPGVFLKIKRWRKIKVEALDENGKKFKVLATGLLSHCLQQEIDHLNGILILDRMSFWQKLKRKF
ncbi:MAG: peptide deformylase [Candidatus Nealsonbacteria bacterium]|nr:MAG: peptide deformylase [Candidatus Nealsonbacteria bacterium]